MDFMGFWVSTHRSSASSYLDIVSVIMHTCCPLLLPHSLSSRCLHHLWLFQSRSRFLRIRYLEHAHAHSTQVLFKATEHGLQALLQTLPNLVDLRDLLLFCRRLRQRFLVAPVNLKSGHICVNLVDSTCKRPDNSRHGFVKPSNRIFGD